MTGKKTAAAGKKSTKSKEPFIVVHKRSGRYAVVNRATGKYVNGADKLAVLVSKGLVKAKIAAKPAADAPAAPAAE